MPHLTEPENIRPRVEHAVASSGLYGMEHVLLNLLPESLRQGANVGLTVFGGLDGSDGAVGRAAAELGVPVGSTGRDGTVRPAFGLARRLRAVQASAVHFHGYKATILGGAVCVAKRIPAVATCHAEALKVPKSPFVVAVTAAEAYVLRNIAGVIAVSDPVGAELEVRGVAKDRIRVIPNGVLPSSRQGAARTRNGLERGPGLLIVGRLAPEKRVDWSIRTLADLKPEFPGIFLVIAGDGPLRADLERLASELGVGDSVQFLGFVADVRTPLRACDCFVMPSETEGSPMALLEAMAEGAPIVASHVGGIPLTVSLGREALLFAPDNRLEMVAAVRRVLTDPGLARNLGEAAQQKFLHHYSVETMAQRYQEFYRDMLSIS